MLFYSLGDLRLCWTQIHKCGDCWFPVYPSVNDLEFFLLIFYHYLSSDSDGVLNLCNVGSLLIMLHELWLERLFLWLAGLPTKILCSNHTG